jgi:hypothetical protein
MKGFLIFDLRFLIGEIKSGLKATVDSAFKNA